MHGIPGELVKGFSKDTGDSDGVSYLVIQLIFGDDAPDPRPCPVLDVDALPPEPLCAPILGLTGVLDADIASEDGEVFTNARAWLSSRWSG